jgi:hypothetical protein
LLLERSAALRRQWGKIEPDNGMMVAYKQDRGILVNFVHPKGLKNLEQRKKFRKEEVKSNLPTNLTIVNN